MVADSHGPRVLSGPPEGRADAGARYGQVASVLYQVLFLNLAVAFAKIGLGTYTGSVSIVSDGFHSLTDSASNVVGLVGISIARQIVTAHDGKIHAENVPGDRPGQFGGARLVVDLPLATGRHHQDLI